MIIKLLFNDALAISPLAEQDTLVIHIAERRDFFVSNTLQKNLHQNYTTLTSSIKKQMPDDKFTHTIVETSENSKLAL